MGGMPLMSILSIRDLKVNYHTQDGAVQAVDRLALDLDEGQRLGLIGESGCGKTTLLKAIVQVLPRNGHIVSGEIKFKGTDLLKLPPADMRELRWREIATIPQASMDSLNPVQRVGSQLIKLLRVRGGYDKRAARRRAVDLFDMVGLDTERLMHYPHEFSGGMKQRAVIAMALALEPSLLIADEPVTALDVIVQHQILEVLRELERELNLTVMLITHDISVVAQVCDSVSVMYAGRIVEEAAAEPFFASPAHPYSLGLQQAFPNLARPRDELVSIEGYPPDLREPPSGCRFAERCPFAQSDCHDIDPQLDTVGDGRSAACLRSHEMDSLRLQAEDPSLWQQVEVAQLVGQAPPKSPPIAMEGDLNVPPLAANSVETLPLHDASGRGSATGWGVGLTTSCSKSGMYPSASRLAAAWRVCCAVIMSRPYTLSTTSLSRSGGAKAWVWRANPAVANQPPASFW